MEDKSPPTEESKNWFEGSPTSGGAPKVIFVEENRHTGRPTHRISFEDAIKSGFSNFVNFEGRSSRSEYWWFTLFGIMVGLSTTFLDVKLGYFQFDIYSEEIPSIFDFGPASLISSAVLFLPILSLSVRRLHDLGYSGWFALLLYIPLIKICFGLIFFILMFIDGDAAPNTYGMPPTNKLKK